MGSHIPLVVEFAPGSRVEPVSAEEGPLLSEAIPRDAVIRFADGRGVPIPADQIVHEEQKKDAARIGFGGVSFEGMIDGRLAFWRVKDLVPEELLHADRDIRFLIDPEFVSEVVVRGVRVWPDRAAKNQEVRA